MCMCVCSLAAKVFRRTLINDPSIFRRGKHHRYFPSSIEARCLAPPSTGMCRTAASLLCTQCDDGFNDVQSRNPECQQSYCDLHAVSERKQLLL